MKSSVIRILHLDESESDSKLIAYVLNKAELQTEFMLVSDEENFRKGLEEFAPDVVIAEYMTFELSVMTAMEISRTYREDLPFIVCTGLRDEKAFLELLRKGANDCILKTNLLRLPNIIEKAILEKELKEERNRSHQLNEELTSTYETVRTQKEEIISSIQYAERIVQSMLPGEETFDELGTDAFVMHQPKDIIGGDFYFVTKTKTGFIAAVADCTGHGVPGALISMVGYSQVRDIVRRYRNESPAFLLGKLHERVLQCLNSSGSSKVNDGMDIALCHVNTVDKAITFSGANQSLYLFNGKEVKMIRGDKKSIGDRNNNENFSTVNINYEEGDRIYMTSDGYYDQFGCRSGRRLMRKNFIQVLLGANSFPMNEQKDFVRDFFQQWKSTEEQTDDVLVMGIEL